MPTNSTKPRLERRPGRPKIDADYVSARQSLLDAAVKLVGINGATDVTAKQVCDLAGTSTPSVNHNFGSWTGLLAEATIVAFEGYIEQTWAAANAAGEDPEARLRAYAKAQVQWNRENPGWGAVFNYPFSARAANELVGELFGERYGMAYALGQLHWGMLVFDVRQGRFSGIEIDPTNLPIETSPEDRQVIFRSIVESWAIMGMSLWAACGATFESPMSVIYQNQDDIMEFCIDEVVRAIKSDRAPLAGQ